MTLFSRHRMFIVKTSVSCQSISFYQMTYLIFSKMLGKMCLHFIFRSVYYNHLQVNLLALRRQKIDSFAYIYFKQFILRIYSEQIFVSAHQFCCVYRRTFSLVGAKITVDIPDHLSNI